MNHPEELDIEAFFRTLSTRFEVEIITGMQLQEHRRRLRAMTVGATYTFTPPVQSDGISPKTRLHVSTLTFHTAVYLGVVRGHVPVFRGVPTEQRYAKHRFEFLFALELGPTASIADETAPTSRRTSSSTGAPVRRAGDRGHLRVVK